MTAWPAPRDDKSTVIKLRDLFGDALRISTEPDTSPPGIESVMLPVMRRDFNCVNAARPPSAVMLLAITSSAVCADAIRANNAIDNERIRRVDVEVMNLVLPVEAQCSALGDGSVRRTRTLQWHVRSSRSRGP